MVSLATLGIGAFVYRSVLGSLLVRRRPYRVAGANRLDEFVTEVVMEPRDRPLTYSPGQIWIAGGIGVTPFLSMARSLDGDAPAVDFYYCVEHEPEAHFVDEIRSIAREREDFRVAVVPRDREGFLTADRVAAENEDLASADVLICGPPAMIESLRSQLKARGLPGSQIHAEEFSFAKLGRPRAAGEPSALAADPKLFASLAAVAFAGPALAIAILVASYLVGGR